MWDFFFWGGGGKGGSDMYFGGGWSGPRCMFLFLFVIMRGLRCVGFFCVGRGGGIRYVFWGRVVRSKMHVFVCYSEGSEMCGIFFWGGGEGVSDMYFGGGWSGPRCMFLFVIVRGLRCVGFFFLGGGGGGGVRYVFWGRVVRSKMHVFVFVCYSEGSEMCGIFFLGGGRGGQICILGEGGQVQDACFCLEGVDGFKGVVCFRGWGRCVGGGGGQRCVGGFFSGG